MRTCAYVFILVAVVTQFSGCRNDDAGTEWTEKTESPPRQSDSQNQNVHAIDDEPTAMNLYRQAQALIEAGQYDEGYANAKQAMALFIAEKNDLAWLPLESISLDDRRVDVHFNMGPAERVPKDNGIIRPLSFRIWSSNDDAELLDVIDFEIARFQGKSMSAAIGRTHDSGHDNLGILDIDASYESIRTAVLDLIERDK